MSTKKLVIFTTCSKPAADRGERGLQVLEALRRLRAEIARPADEAPAGVMPSWPAM